MPGFVLRWATSALALWVAAAVVPGMTIRGTGTLLLAALLLGLANAVVRPVVILLTLPVTLLSLGLFLLVINAAMLGLVAALLANFTLAGFGSALLGSILVSLVGWLVSWNIGSSGRYEVLIVRRD
jgi:putative membrane protein